MPRYYFDLDSPTIRAVDDFGDLLASDDLALDYAVSVLCENMRGKPAAGGTILVVTVRDDNGPRFQARAAISVGAIGAAMPMSADARRLGAATTIGTGLDSGSMPKDIDCSSLAPRDPN